VQNRSANELAIVGYEWIIVLVIIVVLFVWGPQKLPEFAKSIGLARKEIEKAYKEASDATASPAAADPLIETAKKLGISTEGKTRSQISDEIVAKGKASTTTITPTETDPLVETAKRLGISTEGKTRSQMSDEIVAKGKASEKPA
jgi:sec-independent protein translocase protein TatA